MFSSWKSNKRYSMTVDDNVEAVELWLIHEYTYNNFIKFISFECLNSS